MDRFEEMRVFTAVVEAGSFVKAAEALRMSKAGVSRHVTELETRLGVRLMQRTTRRQSLTEEGQLFYERCKVLLAEVEDAETEVNSRSAEVGGLLRINAPLTFGVCHLAPLWAEFKAHHPRLVLDITLSDRLVDLVDEGYDVAVRISQLPDSTLVSRRLASTRMVLCASPDYIREHGMPEHPRELVTHSTIAYSYWSGRDEWRFHGPEGEVSVRIQPIMRANNGDTCVAAALARLGIVFQPTFLVGDALRKGTLLELMPQYRGAELGIYAVYPTRRHVPPRVRAVLDFLAAHFAQARWPD
ncbi:LysR family transcriptional regulator [Bordetella genomosp. 7]|uniref:LysR family transcriptional regulator n=1 Tax=Bordetella genomosp. 7 TaxID=1416805 RepID=A0A261RJR5_9BORD|nr:LysR family transcriptional regulator [Bordetella genomosp. 7]OZI24922.1 LysR family transcriptional regulator [Bordetella genomosp. 7]OZI27958.1 LysR family transcriptional regulator [Bordetella genomosp. 7]